jgi:hypothetical protein
MLRYGRGRALLHRKHPRAFTWESLVPAAFVLGLVALAASPWLPPPLRLAVLLAYGTYVVLSLLFSVAAARRAGVDLMPLLPVAFATTHVGLGLGYLDGLLRGARRAGGPKGGEGAERPSPPGADAP